MHEEFPLRQYVSRTPEKQAAWNAFHAAVAVGNVTRGACEVCGSVKRIHGHHPDYSRPLDVMWLCPRHHIAWHRENGPGVNGGDAEEDYAHFGRDITGERRGHLVVIAQAETGRHGVHRAWRCRCGAEFGFTRERARQLESRALEKMRRGFDKKPIRTEATVKQMPKRQSRKAA